MVATIAIAVMDGKAVAMIFAALLALGLGVLWKFKRYGARRRALSMPPLRSSR